MSFPRPVRRALVALAVVGAALAAPAGAASAGLLPTVAGETLSATAVPPSLAYGDAGTLTGLLTSATGDPVPNAPVVLDAMAADGSWTVVGGPLATDAAGVAALPVAPQASAVLRLRHDVLDGATSAPVVVPVSPRLTATLDRDAVRVGRQVRVTGTLDPSPAGAVVRLERRSGGSWRLAERATPHPDGTWELATTPDGPGSARYRVVRRAGGGLAAASVDLGRVEVYRLYRYSVTTRGRIHADVNRFRAVVAATYADPRGWRRAHVRFREVARGGHFTVVLSQARYLPAFSGECSTTYSCRVGRHLVINQDRWRLGSPYYPGGLESYRQMVINHETGHWLGRGHASCPRRGALAPVMQQQSKGMQGCRVNPWPLPGEIRDAR